MASNSSWTFLSSFNLFSAFAAKPTEQSNAGSIEEPLLAKQNQDANASAPIKEAPTVSGTNSGTQSTTLYSRLVGMFTSWTKEKEPPAQSAKTSSPTPSVQGSSRSSKRSVTFGSELSKVLPSEPGIHPGEETTKALKQPNSKKENKSPAVVVASVSPPVNTYAKAPRAQTTTQIVENEPRAKIKVAEDTPTATNITPSKIELPSNTEKSVFETFAQQFVEAKNNVQNTAGTVISEVSSNASERTQSAVHSLTSLFENMGHPPSGPSVAGINSQAPIGPVDNSSKAPATGPVSSSNKENLDPNANRAPSSSGSSSFIDQMRSFFANSENSLEEEALKRLIAKSVNAEMSYLSRPQTLDREQEEQGIKNAVTKEYMELRSKNDPDFMKLLKDEINLLKLLKQRDLGAPAGPSVAEIDHQAPGGPVDNSSKAPGSTPATGPVSSSDKENLDPNANRAPSSSGSSSFIDQMRSFFANSENSLEEEALKRLIAKSVNAEMSYLSRPQTLDREQEEQGIKNAVTKEYMELRSKNDPDFMKLLKDEINLLKLLKQRDLGAPAGPSVAGINSKASTGPVDNSSKAPGSTPATGPVSSSSSSSRGSSSSRSSSRSSVSSQGSGSASTYYGKKMRPYNPEIRLMDENEEKEYNAQKEFATQQRRGARVAKEKNQALAGTLDLHAVKVSASSYARLEKLNEIFASVDANPAPKNPRHQPQSEKRKPETLHSLANGPALKELKKEGWEVPYGHHATSPKGGGRER